MWRILCTIFAYSGIRGIFYVQFIMIWDLEILQEKKYFKVHFNELYISIKGQKNCFVVKRVVNVPL